MSERMTDLELVTAYDKRFKNLSRKQRADQLGVRRQTYYGWLNGEGIAEPNRARMEELLSAPEDRGPAFADGYAAALSDIDAAVLDLQEKLDRLRRPDADVRAEARKAHDELKRARRRGRDEAS